MRAKNIIVLVGNGFDIANGLKTKFSDFADYYIDNKIIPELRDVIVDKNTTNKFFTKLFINRLIKKTKAFSFADEDDAIWMHTRNGQDDKLKDYIIANYQILGKNLKNSLLGKLYSDTNKNWFDIENTYFRELIKFKEQALRNKDFDVINLKILNKQFFEIKTEVAAYLNSIEDNVDRDIIDFLKRHFGDVQNVYFVNFNYTNSLRNYINLIQFKGTVQHNHIHGDLKSGNIVFGYGNDQNTDYQEIKDLEIDEFLRYFKTFDYLNNANYDKINQDALDKFKPYEVYILGHSLGLTDKTLLSEILNSENCKKIRFFKRSDIISNPTLIQTNYREMTYAASRILKSEKELRNKIINFDGITTFP